MALKLDKEPYEVMTIDMTPMVDAIFAIILFLLVASSFVDSLEQDMAVQLPTKSKVPIPSENKPQRIVVNVRHSGGGEAVFLVNNEVQSRNGMVAMFSRARVANPEQEVVVRGDRRVAWDHIADVMSACAQAGIRKFSATVATQEE
jgi:biopolymer transport protein ExbD